MTSLTGKQTTAIHVLPNVSRSKCNQIMKFGYLYNRACVPYLETLNSGNFKSTFLEWSYAKCDAETIPRPFSKKQKLSISVDR